MKTEEQAYLAGIIDGEGSIWIERPPRGTTFVLLLVVANTDPRLMVWLAPLGGSVTERHQNKPTHKPGMLWRISGKRAVGIIREIYPFLKLKKEQATIALAYWDLHGRYHVKAGSRNKKPFVEEASVLKEAMSVLNKKGNQQG